MEEYEQNQIVLQEEELDEDLEEDVEEEEIVEDEKLEIQPNIEESSF